jgi:hypothetical protein
LPQQTLFTAVVHRRRRYHEDNGHDHTDGRHDEGGPMGEGRRSPAGGTASGAAPSTSSARCSACCCFGGCRSAARPHPAAPALIGARQMPPRGVTRRLGPRHGLFGEDAPSTQLQVPDILWSVKVPRRLESEAARVTWMLVRADRHPTRRSRVLAVPRAADHRERCHSYVFDHCVAWVMAARTQSDRCADRVLQDSSALETASSDEGAARSGIDGAMNRNRWLDRSPVG